MDRKCLKALKNINRLIDGDYQKLCDQMHNLELSHNRKKRALQKILSECNEHCLVCIDSIIEICEDALFSDGRERMKGVKK